MKPLCLLAFAFLLFSFIADCQDICTLSGRVLDIDKKPVASGEIFILREYDSSILSKASILKGTFVFEPIMKGEYLLKITSEGFKDKLQLLALDETKSIVISMESSTSILKEAAFSAIVARLLEAKSPSSKRLLSDRLNILF